MEIIKLPAPTPATAKTAARRTTAATIEAAGAASTAKTAWGRLNRCTALGLEVLLRLRIGGL
jgi:hypothetical protein